MKNKTVFVCNECGYESVKWLGRCSACGAWNSMFEEKVKSQKTSSAPFSMSNDKIATAVQFNKLELNSEARFSCGIGELDGVLGGGIVEGSLILVGGDPGIGKSTLLLQMCNSLPKDIKILYVSGEESGNQIKMRGQRLKTQNENLYLLSDTNMENIIAQIEKVQPKILIIDSVQTMYSPDISSVPGSVSQVREAAVSFMRIAKEMNVSVFLVGHVTKDGAIAGPKILEHIVDCVLYFEGEQHHCHRILRCVKNRFGSTNEIGVFEMHDSGLAEVKNPSMLFLEGRPENEPGSCVVCTIEGSRPMLAEFQALVADSSFNNPKRMATGTDHNRVSLLMAVLEKRVGLNLAGKDAYVNVIGGIRIDEPAADLAIVLSIASAFRDKPIGKDYVAMGEVGLTGELRGVNQMEKRLAEAEKLGFTHAIIPKANEVKLPKDSKMTLHYAGTVYQALQYIV